MARKFPLEIVINAIDKLSAPLAEMSRKLDKFGLKTKRIGESMTKGITLPLGIAGGVALRSSAQLESLQTRFESLTGSIQKAAMVTKQLSDFAAATPFELLDVGNAGANLLAAGFTIEEMIPNLKILGDVAAGAQTNLADMVPLYTEIRLKGKAFTQDLRQFATRGIPIVAVLAKHLGKTEEQIFDLASKSKITFPLIQKALESMTKEGGLFANQMQKQSLTLAGLFSTAKDSINIASAAIGDAIVETTDLKDILVSITEAANKFAGWFKELPGPVRNAAVWVGLFVFALGPLLVVFGQMLIVFAAGILLFSKVAAGIGAITAAGLITVAAFVAMGAALGVAWYQLAKLKDMAGTWGTAFKAAIIGIGVLIGDALIKPFQDFLALIRAPLKWAGVKTPGLDSAINYSFGNSVNLESDIMGAGDFAAKGDAARERVPDSVLRRPVDSTISQAGSLRTAPAETHVQIDFSNMPKGTDVKTTTKGNVTTDITQGYQMGAGLL